jgi:hypothetical protein
MGDRSAPVDLAVSIEPDAAWDPDQIDALTRRLRQQLLEFDVDSVKLASAGEIPAGAKSAEAIALGTVLVTVAPAVLPKIVDFLQAWMLRGAGTTVKIRAAAGDKSFDVEYSPGATSEAELNRLLQTLSKSLQTL